MEHKVDAVVAGVGTGGTITGLSRFFARVVAARPKWCWPIPPAQSWSNISRLERSARRGSWLVEGIGEDFIPPVCDLSRVKKAYSIPDKEAFARLPRAAEAAKASWPAPRPAR